MMIQSKIFIETNNLLGEGPVWDALRNELGFVDIERKMLCFCNISNMEVTEHKLECRIGAYTKVEDSNSYLLALQSGIQLWNRETGELTAVVDPESELTDNRFNDGKCDSSGRFWFGSMDIEAKENSGALYCLEHDLTVKKHLSEITISNGMDWNRDNNQMYFVDTVTQKIDRYRYHQESRELVFEATAIEIPTYHGAPDGFCIDREGMLWIAHWGTGTVKRWNPETGKLLNKINVPAPHVTSCCFGGENLDILFITTAKLGLSEEQLKQYPLSGSIFCASPGVKGYLPNYFKQKL